MQAIINQAWTVHIQENPCLDKIFHKGEFCLQKTVIMMANDKEMGLKNSCHPSEGNMPNDYVCLVK